MMLDAGPDGGGGDGAEHGAMVVGAAPLAASRRTRRIRRSSRGGQRGDDGGAAAGASAGSPRPPPPLLLLLLLLLPLLRTLASTKPVCPSGSDVRTATRCSRPPDGRRRGVAALLPSPSSAPLCHRTHALWPRASAHCAVHESSPCAPDRTQGREGVGGGIQLAAVAAVAAVVAGSKHAIAPAPAKNIHGKRGRPARCHATCVLADGPGQAGESEQGGGGPRRAAVPCNRGGCAAGARLQATTALRTPTPPPIANRPSAPLHGDRASPGCQSPPAAWSHSGGQALPVTSGPVRIQPSTASAGCSPSPAPQLALWPPSAIDRRCTGLDVSGVGLHAALQLVCARRSAPALAVRPTRFPWRWACWRREEAARRKRREGQLDAGRLAVPASTFTFLPVPLLPLPSPSSPSSLSSPSSSSSAPAPLVFGAELPLMSTAPPRPSNGAPVRSRPKPERTEASRCLTSRAVQIQSSRPPG